MFGVGEAQTAIGTVLSNLSYQIFVYIGWVLGILVALLGLGMAIHWAVHYITGHVSMGEGYGSSSEKGSGAKKGDWWNHINTTGRDVTGRPHSDLVEPKDWDDYVPK